MVFASLATKIIAQHYHNLHTNLFSTVLGGIAVLRKFRNIYKMLNYLTFSRQSPCISMHENGKSLVAKFNFCIDPMS